MQPRERLGLRLSMGALFGAAWSLIPALLVPEDRLACFVAGIPTGMFITWLYTCTSLESPEVYGLGLLPVGTSMFTVLFLLVHELPAGFAFSDVIFNFDSAVAAAIGWLIHPFHLVILALLSGPAIASTCLLALIFRKRPPRRRDLLPERWDG